MVSLFQTTGRMAAEILFRRLFESNLHIPVETALSSSAVQVDVATRKIYFIRHGEYDWHNPQSKDLTDIGVQQAEWTAKRLANLSAQKIYSSDLPRALQTAEIIRGAIKNVEYEIDAGLRECLLPIPSLSNVPLEVQKAGEQHATAAFAKYMRPAEQKEEIEIVVSHGNLIRYLIARALGQADRWIRFRTLNCGISEVHVESDGIWVVSYNDVGHLPAHLVTYGLPPQAYSAPADV